MAKRVIRRAESVVVDKEIFSRLTSKKEKTWRELSQDIGYGANWLSAQFSHTGKAYFSGPVRKLLCMELGCTEEELTAAPKVLSEQTAPPINLDEITSRMAKTIAEACKYDGASARQHEEMYNQITVGFAMLHTDLRDLIETLNKYWGPAPMPTIDRGQAERHCVRK